MNEHLGLPGFSKTLRTDVFDGGLSSARNRAIIYSEPSKSFANAWLLRTECRTGCRGVSRILDNDEEIFNFCNYEDNRQSCPSEISLERK